METVSSNNEALPPSGKKKGFADRIKRINRLFLLTIVAPTTIAVVYFGLFASDIYVSESRFVVRSPQHQTQTSVVGALLQGTGFSRAQDDTYPVIDYIESRDALRELNQNGYVAQIYGQQGDILSRFPSLDFDRSFESLLKYYQKNVVSIEFDSTSAIATLQTRAFTAKEAEQINEALLDMSERLINRMNARAADDSVKFAQDQVDSAERKAKDAASALAVYRNANTVFDPDRQSALQLQQVTALQTKLLEARTNLAQLQALAPSNPQIASLKTEINTLEAQVSQATTGVAGGKNSLSEKAATYARLQLSAQFADRQLSSAMALLETSRAEAQRKQLYLERLVQPNQPDKAIEPKRLRSILITFLLGAMIWGVASLLIAGMREHHD